MTQPYTESEVNAPIAATVDELKARIQQLETYSRCDAETIEQLQGRVGEHQEAIRRLISALRIACPNGNAWADCYDIPTFTGEDQ
jgi:hypothetical protein